MANGHGGARPGAGRKPTAVRFASEIAKAEKQIGDRLPLIVDSLIDLAAGVLVEETDSEGQPKVYRRPPDRASAEYLLNRIMGKPTEPIQVTGEGSGPLVVKIIKGVSMEDL